MQSAPGRAPAADVRRTPSEENRRRTSTERTRTVRARPWMIGLGVGGFVGLMALVSFLRRSGDAPERAAATNEPAPATPEAALVARAAEPPLVVPTAPAPATPPALPAQEPVNLKRAARLVEPASARTPAAPALAAPWPAESPPVFPQEASAAPGRRSKRGGEPTIDTNATPKPAAVAAKPAAAEDTAATGAGGAPAAAAPNAPAAPPTPDAILARGQVAFDRGNYAEAIRRAKEAMAVGAAVPGHLLVADSYYHLQRYADALREYEAALALEPSNALARRGRELASRAAAADR
jgi:hypothetical protein